MDSKVEEWVSGYKWREKVRHKEDIDLKTPEVRRNLATCVARSLIML